MTEAALLRAAERGRPGQGPRSLAGGETPKPLYDVLVIGSGPIPLIAALSLMAEHDLRRVGVVAPVPETALGVVPMAPAPWQSDAMDGIWRAALDLWPRLATALGLCADSRATAAVELLDGPAETARAAWRGNALRADGRDAVLLSGGGLSDLMPGADPVAGDPAALRHGMGHVLRADLAQAALHRAVLAMGGDVLTGLSVDGLRVAHSQVCGVNTTRGPVAAGHVVVADLPGADGILGPVGVSHDLVPLVRLTLETDPVPGLCDPVLAWSDGMRAGQDRDGRIALDITASTDPDLSELMQLAAPMARLARVVPGVVAAPLRRVLRRSSCVRGCGRPLLDQPGLPGLSLAGGWVGQDWALAPWAGRAVASLAVRGSAGPLARGFALRTVPVRGPGVAA